MATFPVDIVVSTPGAQQLAPLNRQLDQTDRAASGAATAVKALAAAAAAIGVGSAVTRAIQVNRDFNKSISELSAITGATGRDLKFLTDASKEFGATTTLSASQAATAFKLIASAKPDLLANVDALKAVTREAITLAEAAGIDLPQAANALGNSLNQFGAEADQAGRFINVLAAGAKFGSSSIAETSEALKNAGVSAANAKVSFEQTNAAIQALATSGLRGAEAGTGLRNVLTILDTNVDKNLRPSVVGLSAALEELASRQLDNVEFVKLFGRENQNAARILLNQRENFDGLTAALTGSSVAYEQAARNVDNLNGDLLALASAFEGVQIEAASLADGGLRQITQALTVGLQGLNENPERIAEALESLGVAATAVAAVIAGRLTAAAGTSTAAFVRKTTATLASIKADQVKAAQAVRVAVAEKQSALAVLSTAQAQFRAATGTGAHTLALNAQLAAQTRAVAAVGAYNTAVAAQAAVATRAAIAVGVLNRALGFLGGPVGVLLLAVTAFAAFSGSADEATETVKEQKFEVDLLTASFKELTTEQRQATAFNIQDKITQLESERAILQSTLDLRKGLTAEDLKSVGVEGDPTRGQTDPVAEIQRLNAEIKQYETRLKEATTPTKDLADATSAVTAGAIEMSESYAKLHAELSTGIILTQQSERQAFATAQVAKLSAEATDQERSAVEQLALAQFDLAKSRRDSEANEQARQAIDGQVTALQQQLVALNLTGEAQAVYNANTRLGTEATDAQRANIEALTAAIYQRQEALRAEQTVTQFDQSTESPVQRLERESEELRAANELVLQSKEEFAARDRAITEKLEADKLKITRASQSAMRVATAQGLDALAGIVESAGGKQTKAYRAIYAASRAFALADSIAKVTQASAQALADPTAVTLPQKFANYAAVATAGAGLISALKPQQFADGGDVVGTGTGRSDDILALLSNGEKVMTAQRTAQYRSELNAMERGTFNANSGGQRMGGVTIINNVSDSATVTTSEGPDGELIATIDRRIADQTPSIMEQQLADPYSGSRKQLNSAYRLERR